MLYCRDITQLGPLGQYMDPPEYRLFSEKVKDDINMLKRTTTERIERIRDKIILEKQKYIEKINSTRTNKETIPQGTIVFVRNFSIPKSGRDRKFRPYYLRSPQIVLTSTPTSVVTIRIADSFISRHHPDHIIQYKGKEKNKRLYECLPNSVLDFLGKPLTTETIAKLAKDDTLDIIYTDKNPTTRDTIMTRSKQQKANDLKRAMQLVEAASDAEMHDDYDDDEDIIQKTLQNEPKTIRELDTILEEEEDNTTDEAKIARIFLKQIPK